MADNVTVATVSGNVVIATDDISSVHYQRAKMVWGVDGVANDVSANAPLPVTAPAAARTTHSIAVSMQTDALMVQNVALTPKYFSETVVANDADEELIAAVTGKRLRIISLVCHCGGTATDATFESGGSTRLHKVPAGANGGEVLPANPWGWFETGIGASLTVTTGAGSSTEISGTYIEV